MDDPVDDLPPKQILKRFRPNKQIGNDSLVLISMYSPPSLSLSFFFFYSFFCFPFFCFPVTLLLTSISLFFILLLDGRPGSGKTTILVQIVHKLAHKVDGAMLLTKSIKCIQSFKKHLPATSYINVVDRVDVRHPLPNQMTWEDAQTYMDNVLLPAIQGRYNRYVEEGREPKRWLLILDDLAFDKANLQCPFMMALYSNFRQIGVIPIIISQEIMQMPKIARTACTTLVIFKILGDDNMIAVRKAYFDMLDKKTFSKLMATATNAPTVGSIVHGEVVQPKTLIKGCLVIDRNAIASSDSYLDYLSYMYTDATVEHKDWLVGNKLYFTAAEQVHTSERNPPVPVPVVVVPVVPVVAALPAGGTAGNPPPSGKTAKPEPAKDSYDPNVVYLEGDSDEFPPVRPVADSLL